MINIIIANFSSTNGANASVSHKIEEMKKHTWWRSGPSEQRRRRGDEIHQAARFLPPSSSTHLRDAVSLSLAVLSIPWHGGDGTPGTAPARQAGTTAGAAQGEAGVAARGRGGRRGTNSPRVREGGLCRVREGEREDGGEARGRRRRGRTAA